MKTIRMVIVMIPVQVITKNANNSIDNHDINKLLIDVDIDKNIYIYRYR